MEPSTIPTSRVIYLIPTNRAIQTEVPRDLFLMLMVCKMQQRKRKFNSGEVTSNNFSSGVCDMFYNSAKGIGNIVEWVKGTIHEVEYAIFVLAQAFLLSKDNIMKWAVQFLQTYQKYIIFKYTPLFLFTLKSEVCKSQKKIY